MKIPLKFGLIITAGLVAWVVIAHTLVPDPQSRVHSLGAVTFFNILHFTGLFLGLKAFERERGGKQPFKQLIKTGVSISFVFAVASSLFFAAVLVVIGPKWMGGKPGAQELAPWLVAVQAFAGLVVLTMLFGLVYSTVISFVLAKRHSEDN
jgi:hypothetical protein